MPFNILGFFFFVGGARLSDVVALSTQNISMDMATFQSLDSSVIAVRILNS